MTPWSISKRKSKYEANDFHNNVFQFQLRFLLLRTNHEPVTVRISKSEKESIIYLKTTSGLGGHEPGNILRDENKLLSDKEIKSKKEIISQSHIGHRDK